MVHHLWYVQGRNPWEYSDIELQAICWLCHKFEHYDQLSADEKYYLKMRGQIERNKYFKKMGWPLPYNR